ncbi:MAG: hypothetical protein Q9195_005387 [Heterodermia aff. obscurata]
MSPIKALISLAVLLITTVSALPAQVQERSASCPSGSFRMKLYYQNANGQMVWNGLYANDLGGPIGSTSSASEASTFYVDSNKNLIENGSGGFAGHISTGPYFGQPTNTTVFSTRPDNPAATAPWVQCIQTPQYNMCWAGSNKYIQHK